MLIAGLVLGALAAVLVAVVPRGSAVPATGAVGAPGVRVGVDDFHFASFDARFELGRDADGRSTLRTTEHLVAVFPDHDQNRGIRRAIPAVYDGHPTHPEILSVTDADGIPRPYTSERDGDFLVLTIAVPVGQYVHGTQHYVIDYTARDVTRYFSDTDADEFYWDVNGTGWAQPFQRVRASLHLDPALTGALTGDMACYRGAEGSTERCVITRDGDAITAQAEGLRARHNMTIAVAFEPGTFAGAPFDLFAIVPPAVLLGGIVILGTLTGAVLYRVIALRPAPGRGTIVAWYEPPPGISVPIAANLLRVPQRAFTATLLDLAVRGKVRILHERGAGGVDRYGVRLVDRTQLPYEEAHLISRLFWSGTDGSPEISEGLVTPDLEVRWFEQQDRPLGLIAASVRKNADRLVVERGLRRAAPAWPAWLAVVALMLGLVLISMGFVGNDTAFGITLSIGLNVLIWVGIGIGLMMAGTNPLTEAGSLAVEHLQGLREYIRLAEADRMRMLHSATGAERRPTADGDVVRVYERLLPYAVLFGLEKEWQAELARHYGDESPPWSDGVPARLAVVPLTSHLAALPGVASASSSWGSSSGSSSSGGSSGGGSSGGGGGGGGGGGV